MFWQSLPYTMRIAHCTLRIAAKAEFALEWLVWQVLLQYFFSNSQGPYAAGVSHFQPVPKWLQS